MSRKSIVYIMVLFIFSFCSIQAQEKIPPTTEGGQENLSLKVEDCVQIGLKNSKSLHSSAMNVDASSARYSSAKASKLPSIKVTGAYARLSDVPAFSIEMPAILGGGKMELNPTILDNYQTKVTVSQPLFMGNLLSGNSDLNENLMLASEKDYIRDKNELIYKIKEAYWNLFKAQEFKNVIDENVKQMQAHLKDVKSMYEQGLATNNQVLQVQVQLSNSRLNQIEAENNVRLSKVNLNNTIELPLETDIIISSKIEKTSFTESDLKNLIDKALTNRPELQSMEYKVKASQSGVTIANSSWYPQVVFNANYYYNRPNSRIMPAKDEFKDTWDVSLGLSWDIWTWGKNNDKVNEAKATLSQAEDGLSLLQNGVRLEVTSNYLSLLKARKSIEVTEEGVTQAEENYKVTNDKFKNGMALNTDLLDAEFALLQAKINHTQTLVNYELAIAKIRKSIGE
jgi:outer membrane protein